MLIAFNCQSASPMTEDHRIRQSTMHQTQRHRRIPWMIERALTLYKNPVVLIASIQHHLLDQSRNKITNNTIDGKTIVRNHYTSLSSRQKSTTEATPPCFQIQFKSCRHLASRAIGADHKYGMTA